MDNKIIKPKIYFKEQIQVIMNLSMQTLRRMWNKGKFPKPFMINNRCAWKSEVIEEYIALLNGFIEEKN